MIEYKHGVWGMNVLFMGRGSVIPKALVWSLPCATVTVLLHLFWVTEKGDNNEEMEGINTIWSGFTFVIGFLIVFRSNQAYSRFWESVTLFHQTSGEWMSAFSNILSFCSLDKEKEPQVEEFRQYFIRLLSLLHCNALQTICDLADDTLEVLNVGGIDPESLDHLRHSPDRCEVVLLWIERLVIKADREKILDVAPPILSRAFQELSRGMVSVTNVRKIRSVPFPFPYSQYLSYMLIIHWILTPLVASQAVLKPWWAGIIVFAVSTSYWTLFYIAQEIDQPFGEDANDLPVREMQRHFNQKLEYFVQSRSHTLPAFSLKAEQEVQVKNLNSSFTFRDDLDYVTRSKETTDSNFSRDTRWQDVVVETAGGFVNGKVAIMHKPATDAEMKIFLADLLPREFDIDRLWQGLRDVGIVQKSEPMERRRPPQLGLPLEGMKDPTVMKPYDLLEELEKYLSTESAKENSLITDFRLLHALLINKATCLSPSALKSLIL
mmetsp:Transcript_23557/g.44473  ORF Transcript_23557/g.44473 Transcript_23557/m.44473 type:complete len:492 (-) Transcript_23557:22-1497(-)